MNYNLNKKLIEELGEGRIAIDNTGNLKLDLLKAIMLEAFPKYGSFDGLGGSNKYYFKDRFGNYFLWESQSTTNLPTVSLLDFIEKEWKYTVDYCKQNKVIIHTKTLDEWEQVERLLNSNLGNNRWFVNQEESCILSYSNTYQSKTYFTRNYETLDVINASDFIKNNTKMENKEEIIGYKLVKTEYAKSVIDIAYIHSVKNDKDIEEISRVISTNLTCKNHLKEAGVLDLWFTPVYATKEKVLTLSNGKQVRIAKGKIEAEGKSIPIGALKKLSTPYIAEVHEWKVEFSDDFTYKIGCWYIKLSDIKLIIKEYEELNK